MYSTVTPSNSYMNTYLRRSNSTVVTLMRKYSGKVLYESISMAAHLLYRCS
ncbi:hypothetical protein I79_000184 [Cricetulus griseus]|uniref:Uncharacterized protein n=1 Tax=Cricetulus griseus TaxID=10029 RepID=G3GRN1_CRIGR|nr:hypothetical protein I79_000184 [Cricetulus griseus]